MKKINAFWFRRDLRLHDNHGLSKALNDDLTVLPIFIFDTEILQHLPKNDARVTFIHRQLEHLNIALQKKGSSLLVRYGNPIEVWLKLISEYNIQCVFTNRDYEPYALQRDKNLYSIFQEKGIEFKGFKDQVLFEKNDILKKDGKPYTVYTPYKKQWLAKLGTVEIQNFSYEKNHFLKFNNQIVSLTDIGFEKRDIKIPEFNPKKIKTYGALRDYPAKDHTTKIGIHLRFGTVSVREILLQYQKTDDTFISELIWREFFMQILYHFPNVVTQSFKKQYDNIPWKNDNALFEKWCNGETGYPIVDAGMRELNTTGYMHNRVRMITASFLCKHLLIDWRWGEAYFAEKLLDFDLSANNGNWQWAAGCGCDAAPYFRVFNPTLQAQKFDSNSAYIKKWVPEFETSTYSKPIVEHSFARKRAIETYKEALQS